MTEVIYETGTIKTAPGNSHISYSEDIWEEQEWQRQVLREAEAEVISGLNMNDYALVVFTSRSKGHGRLRRNPEQVTLVRRRNGRWFRIKADGAYNPLDDLADEALPDNLVPPSRHKSDYFLELLYAYRRNGRYQNGSFK